MNEKLEVVISADVSALSKELQAANKLLQQHERNYRGIQNAISQNTAKNRESETQLRRLNSELKKGSISQEEFKNETAKITQEMRDVSSSTLGYQRELKRIGGEIKKTGEYTQNYGVISRRAAAEAALLEEKSEKLGKTTNRSTLPAMMSFSNVITSLPGGIGGVAGSVESFIRNLGSLQKSAGGTANALKMMATSLMGPAGVLMAITAVTAIISTMSGSGVKLSDVLRAVTFSSDEFAKSQRKVAESSREAEGGVMGEIAVLKGLLKVAKDESLARADRQRAIDSINQKFPELHENLRLETVGSEKAATAVDQLTQSLLRQAKIEGVKGLISDTYAEMAELASKSAVDAANWWDIFVAAAAPGGNQMNTLISRGIARQGEDLDELNKKAKTYTGIIESLLGEDIALKGVFTEVDTSKLKGGSEDGIRVPVKAVLDFEGQGFGNAIDATREFNQELKNQIALLKLVQADLTVGSAEYVKFGDTIETLEDRVSGGMNGLQESARLATEAFAKMNQDVTEDVAVVAERQNALMMSLAAGFGSALNSIGDDLSKGELTMESFAQTMRQTVIKVIAASLAQALAQAISGASSSAAATGPAAVATLPAFLATSMGAIFGAFGSIQGFADGGIVGGNSYHGDKILARLNSGELILNGEHQRKLNGMMEAPNMSGGGSNSLEVTGMIQANGQTLQVILDRATSRNNRIT